MNLATLTSHMARRAASRRRSLWVTRTLALMALLATGEAPAAPSAPASAWQDMSVLAAIAREHVLQAVSDPGGRLLVSVVPPDERLRLPACAAPIAETPEGQRLWGWTQVRVRCPGEGGWSLSVRTRVQVFVPAIVARRPVSAGQVLEAADVQRTDVDLTGLPRPTLREESQVVGRVARMGLAAGQAIGAEHLKLLVAVRRGAAVEVTATVGQVAVTSAGTAMQDGAVGELIRVKVPGGRTVQGVVTGDGRVAVQMP